MLAGNLGLRILNADNTVGFVPIDLIDDSPSGLVLSGVPEDARSLSQGRTSSVTAKPSTPVAADNSLITGATGACLGQSQ
jgi:multidrug efflux system membrane fusion protein